MDQRLVLGADETGLQCAAERDRPCGEPTGLQRLADALAGHHVGGGSGVTDEEDPFVRQRDPRRSAPGSARPLAPFEFGVRTERLDHVWPLQQVAPQLGHVAHLAVAVAEDPEPDVRPIAGQRERPRVAGEQVGFEPHDEALGGRSGHLAHVLAEGVPLAR
ncbi:MAG: hypothetical protein R2697_10745 [Ilumatobacteraceae bacterium]